MWRVLWYLLGGESLDDIYDCAMADPTLKTWRLSYLGLLIIQNSWGQMTVKFYRVPNVLSCSSNSTGPRLSYRIGII